MLTKKQEKKRKNKVQLCSCFSFLSFFSFIKQNKTHCSLFYRMCHLYFSSFPLASSLIPPTGSCLSCRLFCIKWNTKLATAANTIEVIRFFYFINYREILHININYCLHRLWMNKFDPRLAQLLLLVSSVYSGAAVNRSSITCVIQHQSGDYDLLNRQRVSCGNRWSDMFWVCLDSRNCDTVSSQGK